MIVFPETVLQFGGGNFLRAFADVFIDQANNSGQNVGRVVIVQSTDSATAHALNAQGGKYHVVIRGLRDGKPVDEVKEIHSVSRALIAKTQWPDVLQIARSPDLKYILSNTTEAGLALDETDRARPSAGQSPRSFPAKLLDVLWHRQEAGAGSPLMILPCELIPKNGERLHSLVLEQATRWDAPPALVEMIDRDCIWLNSLVDRIVSGRPASHALLNEDALLTVTEPFALWAIETHPNAMMFTNPAIQIVPDTAAVELRKIRILNGAHTALVGKAMPMGIVTVREAVQHPQVGPWLARLLDDEVVPTINDRVADATGFVRTTLERFANPFLEHKLSAIALNHSAKVATRLVPTFEEFKRQFGHEPPLLAELLKSTI